MRLRRASALISTLITVAIILVLAVVFMRGGCGGGSLLEKGKSPRADGKGTTVVGLVKADAQDDVCRENLAQVRQAIQIAEADDDDHPPASIAALHLPASLTRCPIGHEPYLYDPATGAVKCPHPGHGKF